MATTSMTFKIEIPDQEWDRHPLRNEWCQISSEHPIYGQIDSYPVFLKTEYNINMIDWNYNCKIHHYVIEFESAQDYILWKLHQ